MDFSSDGGKDIARRAAELCGGALGKSRNSHAADDAPPNYAAASLISFDSAVSPEKVSALPFASVPFSVRRTLRT